MRILVVDDDIDILQLVSIHLIRQGYEVERTSDAQQALALLEEVEVDLAIVDVMMPGRHPRHFTDSKRSIGR